MEEKKDRKEPEEKITSKQVVDREEPEEKIPPKRVVEKRKREEEEMTLEEKVDKLVKIEEKRKKSWNVADENNELCLHVFNYTILLFTMFFTVY